MSVNIDTFRKPGETEWTIPPFATALGAGIMPLFAIKDDNLHHIGTAFLISRAGVFATASHCIMEALRVHGLDARQFDPGEDYDLLASSVRLCVLHTHHHGDGVSFSIWSVSNITVAHPTDIAFGFLHGVDAPSPVVSHTLSFAVPRVDSELRAIGYSSLAPSPLPLAAVRAGEFDWRTYQPVLTAGIGSVRGAVLQGYGIVKGPCVITDYRTRNGMSGGPVVNTDGNICGIVSARITLEQGEGSALSLLYPTLPIGLKLEWKPNPQVTLNFGLPLMHAIKRDLVKTDGSEDLHRIVPDNGRYRIDPLIEKQYLDRVFDSASDLWDNNPSTPLGGSASSGRAKG